MTKTLRKDRKNQWRLYLLVISLPFLVLTILAGYRLHCVMGLQKAVVGERYVLVANSENPNADAWGDEIIIYLERKAAEYDIEFSWSSKERCRAVLLSRIDTIGITDATSFTPEFDAALAKFPHLRVFNADFPGTTPPDKDIAMLLTALHRMKRLEEINLFCHAITDRSFALLAGHPSLSKVNFGQSSITPEAAATLKTLPNLKEVTLNLIFQYDGAWHNPNTQQHSEIHSQA